MADSARHTAAGGAPANAPGAGVQGSARGRDGALTVLVVDESSAGRDRKKTALAGAGFRVEAMPGSAALSFLDAHVVGLVVLDIKPPDMHGFDLSGEIKKRHPGALVLQTSATFTAPEARVAALETGADAYLVEPMEERELVATARALMRVRAAEAARLETELRFAEFAQASPDVLWIYDARERRFPFISPAFSELFHRPPEDAVNDPNLWYSMVHEADKHKLHDVIARCLAGERVSLEYRIVRPNGSICWLRDLAFPLPDEAGGRFVGGLARDITERVETEEQRELFVRELNHRVKNTLAIVQSLASQSRLGASTLIEFESTFTARLHALAHAHDLLTLTNWEGTTLGDVVQGAVGAFSAMDGERPRIVSSGPPVWIDANMAVTLSLAFHELATNAIKHGALSNAKGRVDISWTFDPPKGPSGVDVIWRESGGPPVKAPKRRGFGSMLIERVLAHEMEGPVQLAFQPGGVECRFRLPFSAKVKAVRAP
jgi:PAS domain S-box-containing protein